MDWPGCLLLLISVTIVVGQSKSKSGPSPVCPTGWTISDKNCYKLGNGTANNVTEAELECKSLSPPGARLPVILDETRWNQLANDLFLCTKAICSNATLKADSAFWLSLKHGILPRARKPGWVWLELISGEFLPWKQPPSAAFIEPVGSEPNKACSLAWISGGEKGFWKIPCSLDTPIVTLCERRAFSSIPNFNKANAKLSVAGVAKSFSDIKLPNGKPVKLDITEDHLKKANQKLNEMGQLVANSLGLGANFKPMDSPMRGDNWILPEDLEAELVLIRPVLAPTTVAATTIAATTTKAATSAQIDTSVATIAAAYQLPPVTTTVASAPAYQPPPAATSTSAIPAVYQPAPVANTTVAAAYQAPPVATLTAAKSTLATTTEGAPPNPYGRKKRGNPVKNNNWGIHRNITYNYDLNFILQAPVQKAQFDQAIEFWQQHTCFDFAVSDEPDLIVIAGGGCYSTVGKSKSKPPQFISLGEGCDTFAIASHELAHTLGLAHEQAKADRDKYVDVFMKNVNPSFLDNFRTCCDCVDPEKYPYDYGSVMHYKINEFSTGGPTVLPKDKNFWNVIGNAFEPSFLDVKAVNDLNCKDDCKNSDTKCKNGGYPHPKNCSLCICPTGFDGLDCSVYKDGKCGYNRSIGENPHEFASPDFPEPFGEVSCTWLFQAAKGQVLQIEFSDVFFDMPMDCFYGYIEVKDGKDFTATGRRFCQNVAPPVIISESNTFVVVLKTHLPNDSYRGFSAAIQAIPANQATTPVPNINSNITGVFDRLFDATELKYKRAATLGCANIAGSVQNAGPAGLTLRADNN